MTETNYIYDEHAAHQILSVKGKPMREVIGFTGSQEGMTEEQREGVYRFLKRWRSCEFHHGDCIGADADAHQIARDLFMPIVIHPSTDSRKRAFCEGAIRVEEPLPYMERNQAIVDAAVVLLACPRGFKEELLSGTWATIRRMRKLTPYVIIIWPDGTNG